MSYFEVNQTRYFPFGQGGRAKLLQSLAAISSSSSSSLERLQQCPMHAMPLLAHPADSFEQSGEEDVLTCPNATYPHPLLRAEYAALADSVLCELFKQQAEAILVTHKMFFFAVVDCILTLIASDRLPACIC